MAKTKLRHDNLMGPFKIAYNFSSGSYVAFWWLSCPCRPNKCKSETMEEARTGTGVQVKDKTNQLKKKNSIV